MGLLGWLKRKMEKQCEDEKNIPFEFSLPEIFRDAKTSKDSEFVMGIKTVPKGCICLLNSEVKRVVIFKMTNG